MFRKLSVPVVCGASLAVVTLLLCTVGLGWTEVAEFWGDIIPDLNSGEPTRHECGAPFMTAAAPGPENIYLEFGDVEVGPTAGSADLPEGEHKFICCIHPWMRTTVHVH